MRSEARTDAILGAMPADSETLCELLGTGQSTMWRWLKRLRKEKRCFILRYEVTGEVGRRRAVYVAGQGQDARPRYKKPKAKPSLKLPSGHPFSQLFY